MKQKAKRAISGLLALSMTFSLMAVGASADTVNTTENDETTAAETAVAPEESAATEVESQIDQVAENEATEPAEEPEEEPAEEPAEDAAESEQPVADAAETPQETEKVAEESEQPAAEDAAEPEEVAVETEANEDEEPVPGVVYYDEIVEVNPIYADVVTEEDILAESPLADAPSAASYGDEYEEVAVGENEYVISYTPATYNSSGDDEGYVTTFEEAGEIVREAMKKHDSKAITEVKFKTTESDYSGFYDAIVGEATKHTGVPTEGDYLKFQYGGGNAGISYTISSDGTYYYTLKFYFSYHSNTEQEEAVDKKVTEVLDELNVGKGTDYQKIKAVYDYVCKNVVYDYDNLEDTDYKLKYTAYAALIDGKAVCQGYAVLVYRLLEEEGVDCRIVAGTGNGGSHAWNIVNIGDYYYNVDATWDAKETTEYKYFLKNNDNFEDHTRKAEYETADFEKAYPMAKDDYEPTKDDLAEIDTSEKDDGKDDGKKDDGDSSSEVDSYGTVWTGGTRGEGTWGDNLKFVIDLDEGTLVISGTGDMQDASASAYKYNWTMKSRPYVHTITIEEGVTSIGTSAFATHTVTTTVAIPSTVTKIGANAFDGCSKLATIQIPCTFDKSLFDGSGITVSEDGTTFEVAGNTGKFEVTHVNKADADGYCESCRPETIGGEVTPTEITVAVTSQVDGTTATVANLTGGGTYANGDAVTVTAPAKSGYSFKGWFASGSDYSGTPLCAKLTYQFTPTADVSLVAVYVTNQVSVALKITGNNYSVNGVAQATDYVNSLPLGSEITLVYTGDYNFQGWKGENNNIVSTSKSYTFTLVSATSLSVCAVQEIAGQALVSFQSETGQVIFSNTMIADNVTVPTYGPSKSGYEFASWSMTADQIKAAINDGQHIVIVTPKYTHKTEEYTLTVVYGDNSTDTYTVTEGVIQVVTAKDLSAQGLQFQCWANDQAGTSVLGYSQSYKVKAIDEDMTVYAVYGAEEVAAQPTIAVTNIYAIQSIGKERVGFSFTRDVPEGFTIVETGVLFNNKGEITADNAATALVLGGEYASKGVATNPAAEGVFAAQIVDNGNGVYARGYLIATDNSTGEQVVYYTDAIYETYSGLSAG